MVCKAWALERREGGRVAEREGGKEEEKMERMKEGEQKEGGQ